MTSRLLNYAAGLCLVAAIAYASHGHWIDKYNTFTGGTCCTVEEHCIKVRARILSQDQIWAQVEIDGKRYRMALGSIHTSEDGYDWFCRQIHPRMVEDEWISPLCLFIAPQA